MNAKPDASPPSCAVHFVAAALAATITVGIFGGITELFLREGRPLERLVAAERACAGHEYLSEREACMRERAASQRRVSRAGKRGAPTPIMFPLGGGPASSRSAALFRCGTT